MLAPGNARCQRKNSIKPRSGRNEMGPYLFRPLRGLSGLAYTYTGRCPYVKSLKPYGLKKFVNKLISNPLQKPRQLYQIIFFIEADLLLFNVLLNGILFYQETFYLYYSLWQ